MGIFERLVELARSIATPLDFDPDVGEVSASWLDADDDAPAESAFVPEAVARLYRRLEVPVGSPLPTVRTGYRRLMFEFHPDKFAGDPEKHRMATDVARALTDAYEGIVAHLGE